MTKRIKIILILFTLSVTLSFMSSTYSRYVADSTGNVTMEFANWQILVNNEDITNGETSTIELTPHIYKSAHVKENTIAPSSKGYFDITINPENVDVSFEYNLTLEVLNENMPDILITKYSIIEKDTKEENIKINNISGNTITGTKDYNPPKEEVEDEVTDDTTEPETPTPEEDETTEEPNEEENTEFKFETFTIRVYFEWFEGQTEDKTEEMNDEADTQIGLDSAKNDTKLQIQAKLNFKQKI